MGLFDIFSGKKLQPKKTPPPVPAGPPPADPSQDPNMIRVFDGYGREMFITKQQWRDNVLAGNIKQVWDKPDELYGMIVLALNDGFRTDVVDAARHLYKIDPQRVRATCIWGIILMEENRLDEAEKVFRDHLEKHGEEGVVLTNLAKVRAKRNDNAGSEKILWHALELDPNQDNGMDWYAAIHRDRDGEAAGLDALRRVAALPGSWRARLWLARAALKERQLDAALAYYNESFSCCGNPVPPDMLMQMSGDLGQNGHLPELLRMVEPHFNAEFHGIMVGNNLIKAHLDLGQVDAARKLVEELYALKRLDWKQTLSFWDNEIAKVRVETRPAEKAAQLEITVATIEGPVWLKPDSPAAGLFPAKQQEGLTVCFLGCNAKTSAVVKEIQHQMADGPGRMSRSLPLFLAEQVEFRTGARTKTLVPWILGETPGFVVFGGPWSDENAADYARKVQGDYVVAINLDATANPWRVELRLVRGIDGKCLGTLDASFPYEKPEEVLPALAGRLLVLLAEQAEVEPGATPAAYQVPGGAHFPYYLLRLEQLLAVRCGTMDEASAGFLTGERDIVDGNIISCLQLPENIPSRLVLVQTLLAMGRIRPDVIAEFRERIALLQKEKPLQEPAGSIVRRMLDEVPGL